MVTDHERTVLLRLARATIAARVQHTPPPPLAPDDLTPRLQQEGASFVTLHTRNGALRGCIGSIKAHRPLVEDVRANAIGAAFRDPRFPSVTASELATLVVEVSVLSAPQPLAVSGPHDLIQKLRPGIDGVLIRQDWHQATFLPQVWEQLPQPETFLAHLCRKAGLPTHAWRQPGLEILTYQVEKFSEAEAL